jgi:hypothetical protein
MARDDEQEKVGAWVPRRIVKALKRNAKHNGRTLSGEVRLALSTWVANLKGQT